MSGAGSIVMEESGTATFISPQKMRWNSGAASSCSSCPLSFWIPSFLMITVSCHATECLFPGEKLLRCSQLLDRTKTSVARSKKNVKHRGQRNNHFLLPACETWRPGYRADGTIVISCLEALVIPLKLLRSLFTLNHHIPRTLCINLPKE